MRRFEGGSGREGAKWKGEGRGGKRKEQNELYGLRGPSWPNVAQHAENWNPVDVATAAIDNICMLYVALICGCRMWLPYVAAIYIYGSFSFV